MTNYYYTNNPPTAGFGPAQNVYMAQNDAARLGHRQVVIVRDQSFLKGAIWGAMGCGFLSSTIVGIGATLATAAVFPPLAIPPLVSTLVFGSLTSSCFENLGYHWGSRDVVVLN